MSGSGLIGEAGAVAPNAGGARGAAAAGASLRLAEVGGAKQKAARGCRCRIEHTLPVPLTRPRLQCQWPSGWSLRLLCEPAMRLARARVALRLSLLRRIA